MMCQFARYSLDHVEDGVVEVQPEVVVGDSHGLEGDLLGVLEERVGPPDVAQPRDGQEPGGRESSYHCSVL